MRHGQERDCGCTVCSRFSAYIDQLVTEAPPLTGAQRAKLAELLRPVRITRNH